MAFKFFIVEQRRRSAVLMQRILIKAYGIIAVTYLVGTYQFVHQDSEIRISYPGMTKKIPCWAPNAKQVAG